jgi:hypothetical protein
MGKKVNSPEVKAFIRRHSALFWYTPEDKKEEISEEFLVETILNYGDIDSVKELISILGINNIAKIFFNSIGKSERRKGNYHELTLNYFNLLFKSYAPAHIK